MRLDDLRIPASSAARAALEVATAYCSPALLNHSIRSYLWAAGYGTVRRIAFDTELLYVAALLHDLGLVKEFDGHLVPFEEAGGHVAWVFAAGAGWPVERRRRTAQIIVRHMCDAVDVDLRPDVLARYPRLGLAGEFVACFQDQAARKPDSLAAKLVSRGFAARVAANPLDR
jgi:hypothetical protein